MKYWPLILTMLFIIIGCDNCVTNETPIVFDLSEEFEITSPQVQNVDHDLLTKAFEKGKTTLGLMSLLVVRNGYIVGEEYYGYGRKDSVDFVHSVTKSVISILIGIAVDKGFIDNIDLTLADIFDIDSLGIDEAKGRISIRHMLTMTSGLEWDEFGGDVPGSLLSGNLLQYVLDKELVAEPGTVWNYSTGLTHILSVVITKTTGMNALRFADEYLFNNLGINDRFWYDDDHGNTIGGHGLMLRPRDMAKIGVLMLNKGKTPDVCLSEDWVTESTDDHVLINHDYGSLEHYDYGYLWWVGEQDGYDYYTAWGLTGHFIFCVPELDLVVIITSEISSDRDVQNQQELDDVELLVNYVLPSINNSNLQ